MAPLTVQYKMVQPIDKVFLLMSILALPNLYYQPEYNVPLLFFFFAIWQLASYRPTVAYLLILSWCVDLFVIMAGISQMGKNQYKKSPIVLIIGSVLFVGKVVVLVWMCVADEGVRKALGVGQVWRRLGAVLRGSGKE